MSQLQFDAALGFLGLGQTSLALQQRRQSALYKTYRHKGYRWEPLTAAEARIAQREEMARRGIKVVPYKPTTMWAKDRMVLSYPEYVKLWGPEAHRRIASGAVVHYGNHVVVSRRTYLEKVTSSRKAAQLAAQKKAAGAIHVPPPAPPRRRLNPDWEQARRASQRRRERLQETLRLIHGKQSAYNYLQATRSPTRVRPSRSPTDPSVDQVMPYVRHERRKVVAKKRLQQKATLEAMKLSGAYARSLDSREKLVKSMRGKLSKWDYENELNKIGLERAKQKQGWTDTFTKDMQKRALRPHEAQREWQARRPITQTAMRRLPAQARAHTQVQLESMRAAQLARQARQVVHGKTYQPWVQPVGPGVAYTTPGGSQFAPGSEPGLSPWSKAF
jgi:hypothetical protein